MRVVQVMRMQTKQQTEGERERSSLQEYLSVNWQSEQEAEGRLIGHAHTHGPTQRGERARACDTSISFIQLHKRSTERLPHKLDGILLKYPCGISHFSLALNKWVLILSL
jgi:hypothetical protein